MIFIMALSVPLSFGDLQRSGCQQLQSLKRAAALRKCESAQKSRDAA